MGFQVPAWSLPKPLGGGRAWAAARGLEGPPARMGPRSEQGGGLGTGAAPCGHFGLKPRRPSLSMGGQDGVAAAHALPP